jgi:hypothetical protein
MDKETATVFTGLIEAISCLKEENNLIRELLALELPNLSQEQRENLRVNVLQAQSSFHFLRTAQEALKVYL